MKVEVLKIGVPNSSGRIYSLETVEKAIEGVDFRYGSSFKDSGDETINLDKISHIANKFTIEGDALYCNIQVLETPMGIILQSFIDHGIKIKYGTSGHGLVKTMIDGNFIVHSYQLRMVNWEVDNAL